jgi:hypothetical protein
MSEERDREVDAAWRTASREEPSQALDETIRAEARRAVDAGPREARRRRFRQLRYPFAAAATVALLTFGIAEMTPRDDVAPSVLPDQPAAPRDRDRPAEKAEPRAPAQAPQSSIAMQQPQTSATEPQRKKRSLREESSEHFAAAPPQAGPASGTRSQAASRQSDATAKSAQGAPAAAVDSSRSVADNAAKASHLDELKAKDAGAESVQAWIARIRELKATGQVDAAAKELAKFRTTFGARAEALLPSDLRPRTGAQQ